MREYVVRVVAFIALILFVSIGINYLTQPKMVDVEVENGQADLQNIDLSDEMAAILPGGWEYYPEQLYTPEDFARGEVREATRFSPEDKTHVQYGTYRLVLHLPVGKTYAIAAQSIDYAQRTFINGREQQAIGYPADNQAGTVPKTDHYTYVFTPQAETTEIIFQYANFNHKEGGETFTLYVGEANNVITHDRAVTFRISILMGCLLTACLFFFGMFLFFEKKMQFVFFSLFSFATGTWLLFSGEKLFRMLWPDIPWVWALRIEYVAIVLMALSLPCLFEELFPNLLHRLVNWGYKGISVLWVLIILLSPPAFFSQLLPAYFVFIIAFSAYLAVRIFLIKPQKTLENMLTLVGVGILFAGMLLDILYSGKLATTYGGFSFIEPALLTMIFVVMVAMTIEFSRYETKLAVAHSKEQELVQSNRMLDRMNSMKSELMSTISHEMKTPLTVMSGYAQLSAKNISKGNLDDIEQKLYHISSEATRLSMMVAKLLRVSATEELENSVQSLDLKQCIKKMAELYGSILEKHNNRLLLRIEESLPPVAASEDLIMQVMLNLLTNANRHTHNGTITIEVKRCEDGVQVTFADTGSGIDPELLAHIFEKYTKGEGGSSGLGLAICTEIVEKYGGTLTIESEVGKGTQAHFTVPLYTLKDNEL